MNARPILSPLPALLLGFLFLTGSLQAQWTTQTVILQPGWNAVFLEVQPEPRECDAALAGLPVESVWRWNRRFSTVEFIDDPSTLLPTQPDWLVHLPPAHPLAAQTSLYTFEGGRPYLIKLVAGAGPVTWTVKGKAVVRPVEWLGDSLNLVGFSLPATQTPSFQAFFSGSPAHATQPIYRLNAAGYWQPTSAAAPMRPGEAFWIRCLGQSAFQGPVSVNVSKRTGLDFGQALVEDRISLKNTGPTPRSVQLRQLESLVPPPGAEPPFAGRVPLRYWKFDPAGNEAGWTALPATLSRILAPGEEWEVRLEVQRAEMNAPAAANGVYQSLIEVTDTASTTRRLVPVTAQGMQADGAGGPHARTGLWVGQAEITHVSQPASARPLEPLPVASPLSFRLLVHVDGVGQARLLQKVLQMWRPGTYRTNSAGIREVDQPGRFVLVTDERLIPNFTGAALRDGEPVARRFSSAAFGFREPVPLPGTGEFGADGSQFSGDVVLDYDDPLNPFKHAYHPDHDNRDALYERKLPQGRESFTVTRTVQLQFTAADPDRLALAGWADTQLGGGYRETITGLHHQPLELRGTFRFTRAARIGSLNDSR